MLYDHVQEDIALLAGFLEQVHEFTQLDNELDAADGITDPDRRDEYREAVWEEMAYIGVRLRRDYSTTRDAYTRLDHLADELADAMTRRELDRWQDHGLGDPAQFYGCVTTLLQEFEQVDSTTFRERYGPDHDGTDA